MPSRLLVLIALLSLALPVWGKKKTAISGTVLYRQRMALPPDATVDVQLQDVTLQDAPAKIVSETKIPTQGKQVPIPFKLKYNPAGIDPTHTYTVRATISAGGQMTFTSTATYPVITRGAPNEITIMVEPVAEDRAPSATANLAGTHWKLVELNGGPVAKSGDGKDPNIFLDAETKRLSGTSGCNRLLASYEAGRDSLHLQPAAMTMMACPEPLMKQEQLLTDVLRQTTAYRIVRETLEFLDGERVLARFQVQSSE